jgi:hypothetical protein
MKRYVNSNDLSKERLEVIVSQISDIVFTDSPDYKKIEDIITVLEFYGISE